MGHAVKQRKQRRGAHGHEQRRPDRQRYRQAQGQHRCSNPAFQRRQLQPFETQHPADQHGADKGARQRPARGAFLLGRPEAHRKHGQQVIEAAQGVADTGHQAIVAMARMGEGQGRGEQQRGGGEKSVESHGQVPYGLIRRRSAGPGVR